MTESLHQSKGTYNLFLCVLVGGQQVDCLDLTEVNIVTQQEDEQELADIFLLLVSIQCFIALKSVLALVRVVGEGKVTLNLLLMLANSLFILLISASLLLQFLMSDMKTASPRMPSPRTAGILLDQKLMIKLKQGDLSSKEIKNKNGRMSLNFSQ